MKLRLVFLILLFCNNTNAQTYEIYVSDAGNFNSPPWQILKFDGNGQNPSVFINNNLNWPQDILFIEDSNFVLISNLGTGTITKHNANTGAFISNFATGISGPTRIKIGADGLLYVLQWSGNGKVKRFDLNGNFIDDFTSVGVSQSIGLDWDSTGNLYVSSYNGDLVRKFDTLGVDQGIFVNTNLLGPTNIWFDSNGDLLVADYNGTAVKRFDSNGNYINDFIMGLSNCEGVDFFPNGNILIGNGATSSVKLFDNSGNYLQDIITSGSGNLLTPNAVVLRDITPVSIPDQQINEPLIVYPTIGSTFHLSDALIGSVTAFDILDLQGKKLYSVCIDESTWDASSIPNGIYLIRVTIEDRITTTQKVVVRN